MTYAIPRAFAKSRLPVSLITFILALSIHISGCHPHDHSHDHPATTHLKNYLRLKKKNPDSALLELTQHAKLAFMGHPKAIEWAHIAFRVDRAGKASLPDMMQLSRLNIEMSRDNNAPEEHLQMLESKLLVWQEIEKELATQGQDPNTFLIEFRLQIEK